MNKSDLIARVCMEAGVSRRTASQALDVMLHAITSAVSKGERVTIPGFGTFELRDRAPRTARNPRTGEAVKVPATRVAVFRPGSDFKEAAAGGVRRRSTRSTGRGRQPTPPARKRTR